MSILALSNSNGEFPHVGKIAALADPAFQPYGLSPGGTIRDGQLVPMSFLLPAAPSGTVFVHFRVEYDIETPTNTSIDGHWLSIYDADNNLLARADILDAKLRPQAYGDTTVAGASMPMLSLMTIDVAVTVGATISVSVYLAGSLVSTAVANNTAGKGVPAQVVIDPFDLADNSGAKVGFSEIVVTDGEDTRAWRLSMLSPAGAGNYAQWAGGATELADDLSLTGASPTAPGQRVSSTLSAYAGPATPAGIRAVVARANLVASTAGGSQVRQFLRIGGVDYDGPIHNLTSTMAAYNAEWAVNPATGLPWTTADLAGVEIGLKSEA